MESMPILHENQIFTIFFKEDLAFTEVRGVLDHLLDCNAFHSTVQETQDEYHIHLDQASFHVWVSELNVVIVRL